MNIMLGLKNCAISLISVCCVATLVVAQRTPPPRSKTPTLKLVDNARDLAPLYQSSDPSIRRNGSYIVKLKKTTGFDDFTGLLGKLTDQNKKAPSGGGVPVQGLSGYSTIGLGVMAELNDNALKVVSVSRKNVLFFAPINGLSHYPPGAMVEFDKVEYQMPHGRVD